MEYIVELLKIVLPAALVIYAMYLVVVSFLNKDMEKRLIELKLKNKEVVLPIRLQAYERLALLLERVSPNNILTRLYNSNYSAKEFQQILLHEIREEFHHNIAQQIYVGEGAWNLVQSAVEDVTVLINKSAQLLPAEAKAIDLSKKVFELSMDADRDAIAKAIKALKQEIQVEF
ncbi:hypothetical protein [Penaeicola halotolerans]|uniref:DUF7935 family protein n=1 Tax=Penaeicola halotolerans TaxID=2793196 RepID=UPI001CF7F70C|nr:hypothetical protein [Penaeicola halotolerans]